MLPIVADGKAADAVVSVSISDADGTELFRSRTEGDPGVSAEVSIGERLGGLVARATIRPESAAQLVTGGLPGSRLPLIIILLVVTAGLVVAAVAQLRQEHHLVRLREDFVAGASHELRTPLAQILLFTETLRLGRYRSDEERTRSLEVIDREARRMRLLVENLLHFSRANKPQVAFAPERTDLTRLVEDAVGSFAPVAASRAARMNIETIGRVVAMVDRDLIRQILFNLFDNAVKYGPAGQTVTVGASQDQTTASLWVSDQGPGVRPGDRDRIWQRFWRSQSADSAVGGTGIGLAIVAELTSLHGGTATVEDAPDGGARFVISIPLAGLR